ncbi:MAG: hypothetical protein ACTSRW_08920 [Candidatus Helarchaeota archaeon]
MKFPFKFSKLVLYVLLFLAFYAMGVFLPDLLFGNATAADGSVNTQAQVLMFLIWVPVQEQHVIFPLFIHASTLFEFLIPILSIPPLFYFIHGEVTGMPTYKSEQSRYKKPLEWMFWIFLGLFMVAQGMRYVADAIDTMIDVKPIDININITNPNLSLHLAKLAAYYFDEFLSHKILYSAIVGIMIVLTCLQYVFEKDEDDRLENQIVLLLLGVIFGIAFGFALMEGQAAFEFVIVTFIATIGVIAFSFLKFEGDFRRVPMFLFSAGMFAATSFTVLISGVVFALTGQISMVYPFFPQ